MASPDSGRLADVRELFASLSDAERLRTLPLVRTMHAAVGQDLQTSDVALTVRRTIDTAIESLDSRARTIIVRCDLAGETHRAVADDLSIGERYFYRERRRALLELWAAVTVRRSLSPVTIESEPQDALVGAAVALRNAGRTREGVALLARAHAGEPSARLRVELALRLAQFATDLADPALVAHWAARGHRDVERMTDAPAESMLACCELSLIEIRALLSADEFERAEQCARTVARRLAAISEHRHRDRIGAALGTAYVSLSEARIMRGCYADGLALALEGHARVQRTSAFAPFVEVHAMVAIAQARILATGSVARAGDDFGQAYSRAVTLGLGRDIPIIASNLAIVYALLGENARSAAFTQTALAVSRRTLPISERVTSSVDLAAAALLRRDIACARSIVANALPHARGLMVDILTIADAEVQLASGEPHRALAMVRRAAREIERRGNVRFLGSAHRIEAEALAAIGQRSAAAHSISDALDCLGKAGHPVSLSRAFALSARVTGNRRHRATARELSANLKAV